MFTKDNLSVSFRYYPENRIIVCEFTNPNGETKQKHTGIYTRGPHIYHGLARLKPGEQDNQLEEREVALGRALKDAGYQKEYRRIFTESWKQDYLSRHPTATPNATKYEDMFRKAIDKLPTCVPEPSETKTINGVLTRKIAPTEQMQEGDYLFHNNEIEYFLIVSRLDGRTPKEMDIEYQPTKHTVYRPIPTPATTCTIPDGWYRLEDEERVQKGDNFCWLGGYNKKNLQFELSRPFYGNTVKSVKENDSDPSNCIIRRLPADAKFIKGVWMRKLGPDEYPQVGDWWGDDENDWRGCEVVMRGETTSRKVKDSAPFTTFYRPLTKK